MVTIHSAHSVTHPCAALSAGDPWGWHQGSPRPLSGWAHLPFLLHPAQPQPPPTWGSWGVSTKGGRVQASVDIKFQTKSFTVLYDDLLKYFQTVVYVFIKVKQLTTQVTGQLLSNWPPPWPTCSFLGRSPLDPELRVCSRQRPSLVCAGLHPEEGSVLPCAPPSPTGGWPPPASLLEPEASSHFYFLLH